MQSSSMNPHIAFISVGSNLGDKLDNCCAGVSALTRSPDSGLLAQSPVYRTEPVDYLDQDWFINYVVKIETSLEAQALLKRIKSIEHTAGRARDAIRFGPRVLDLDILLFDQVVLEDAELTIPHPRMHKRRFVLKPICDIDPEINHPVLHLTMRSLLNALNDPAQVIAEYS